ncbi:MAG: 16S rRNA (cytosine(1402)-N(4))-methyltransferase RsmH [Planctomycetota bacterium]
MLLCVATSQSPLPNSSSIHVSVMPNEIVEAVSEVSPVVVVDGTFGGGGHARLCLESLPPSGTLIGIDRDPEVQRRAEAEIDDERLHVFVGSYEKTGQALQALQLDHADAMILDLGLSSDQLEDRSRGFSFQGEGELDLRFDSEAGAEKAWQWLQAAAEKEIADTIFQYGEERYSRRLAREIVARRRDERPVKRVDELVEICRRCVPRSRNHDIHPATRTFQALRIRVNDELGTLERTLKEAPEWLRVGGILAVISFHSLEDRIVKTAFRDDPRWESLTRKPRIPTEAEIRRNARSRSAKLRVARVVETASRSRIDGRSGFVG